MSFYVHERAVFHAKQLITKNNHLKIQMQRGEVNCLGYMFRLHYRFKNAYMKASNNFPAVAYGELTDPFTYTILRIGKWQVAERVKYEICSFSLRIN